MITLTVLAEVQLRGIPRSLSLPLAVLAAMALSACGGDGGSGGSSEATGTLSVGITDAGVEDVQAVWVTFSGITVKPQGGGQLQFPIDPPVKVNLLELQGENSVQLLGDQVVPAGPYNWIALEVLPNETGSMNNLYVETDNGTHEEAELFIPSGEQSGLRLVSGFTVLANSSTDLMIDWDLKKALTLPRNGDGIWKLRPALRITDLAEYGRIEGTVSDLLFSGSPDVINSCAYDAVEDEGNAVYAFKVPDPDPEDATPPSLAERFADLLVDDIDDEESDGESPYATAAVKWDGAAYSYAFDYMAVGHYKLAFTCEAVRDEVSTNNTDNDPEGEEIVDFTVLDQPVAVSDGQTAVAPEFTSP